MSSERVNEFTKEEPLKAVNDFLLASLQKVLSGEHKRVTDSDPGDTKTGEKSKPGLLEKFRLCELDSHLAPRTRPAATNVCTFIVILVVVVVVQVNECEYPLQRS